MKICQSGCLTFIQKCEHLAQNRANPSELLFTKIPSVFSCCSMLSLMKVRSKISLYFTNFVVSFRAVSAPSASQPTGFQRSSSAAVSAKLSETCWTPILLVLDLIRDGNSVQWRILSKRRRIEITLKSRTFKRNLTRSLFKEAQRYGLGRKWCQTLNNISR